MSIQLECLNLVIPIHKLKKKYSKALGDIDTFLEQAQSQEGFWLDEHLYREGAMNPLDLMLRLDEWEKAGLKLTRKRLGVVEWNDLCVVDSFSGPTLPCRWLKYNPVKQSAWLAGTPRNDNHKAETIIFLHGKESTPETSRSAKAVIEYFKNEDVSVPDYQPLARSHAEIEEFLSSCIETAGVDVTLIGISLGGYWAYTMACKKANVSRCILLNPSFRCYQDIPVTAAKNGLPITVVVNLDDEIINPADAIERFTGRASVVTFEKGGHRFDNREQMLAEICKAINTITD